MNEISETPIDSLFINFEAPTYYFIEVFKSNMIGCEFRKVWMNVDLLYYYLRLVTISLEGS